MVTNAQWGESGTGGLRGGEGGALIRPKMALLTFYDFTAILALMEHVKAFTGKYLTKE
jgi:hypothetical protein